MVLASCHLRFGDLWDQAKACGDVVQAFPYGQVLACIAWCQGLLTERTVDLSFDAWRLQGFLLCPRQGKAVAKASEGGCWFW